MHLEAERLLCFLHSSGIFQIHSWQMFRGRRPRSGYRPKQVHAYSRQDVTWASDERTCQRYGVCGPVRLTRLRGQSTNSWRSRPHEFLSFCKMANPVALGRVVSWRYQAHNVVGSHNY